MNWVVGFAFDQDARIVVLIRKTHPEWQAGKLNGVGGKVERTDRTLWQAMVREFYEETGVPTPTTAWDRFASLTWDEGRVHFFRAFFHESAVRCVRSVTDETVGVYSTRYMPGSVVPNLRWLIPLAAHRHDRYDVIDVVETGSTLAKPGRLEFHGG